MSILALSFAIRSSNKQSTVPYIWLCVTEAGHTAPIAEEAETETKFADEKAEVTNPSAQYEGATLSPRHRPPHAYKAKDGKTPVFRPPPTSQYEETTLQAPEYDIAPAATSDRDAHPEAATEFEAIPPDLAAYEADHSQPSIEYGTTYPKSMGYETEPSTAKIESHRPATAEYETADVPSTGHGETHQPLTDASQSDVMYEEETPIQPSIRGSGDLLICLHWLDLLMCLCKNASIPRPFQSGNCLRCLLLCSCVYCHQ